LEREVTKVIAKLDADMDSDNPPFRDLEDKKRVKHYLGACLAACVTAKKQSDNFRLQAEGRALAFRRTVDRLDKLKSIEAAKVEAVKVIAAREVESEQVPTNRLPGMHPGPSLASQRRAEDAGSNGNGNGSAKKKATKKKVAKKKRARKKAKKKTT
jgi:hypothetical protein